MSVLYIGVRTVSELLQMTQEEMEAEANGKSNESA